MDFKATLEEGLKKPVVKESDADIADEARGTIIDNLERIRDECQTAYKNLDKVIRILKKVDVRDKSEDDFDKLTDISDDMETQANDLWGLMNIAQREARKIK